MYRLPWTKCGHTEGPTPPASDEFSLLSAKIFKKKIDLGSVYILVRIRQGMNGRLFITHFILSFKPKSKDVLEAGGRGPLGTPTGTRSGQWSTKQVICPTQYLTASPHLCPGIPGDGGDTHTSGPVQLSS